MEHNIRIAIADDQILFRQSLSMLIAQDNRFELLFDANNGKHFLEIQQNISVIPHVALIDIEMPEMDGIELLEELKKSYPDLKVLILSAYSNDRLIARLIQMGASGYLLKNCDKDELIHAIVTVHEKGFYINEQTLKAIQSGSNKRLDIKDVHTNPFNLTQREIEVLQLICKEMSNMEIAEKLFISPRTVDGHRYNLLLKTGAKNTAGLVLFAVKNNIVEV